MAVDADALKTIFAQPIIRFSINALDVRVRVRELGRK